MLRSALKIAIVSLLLSSTAWAAEVKGIALVKVDDPRQGSLPEIVAGYGTLVAENTRTESFQRDGQVLEIMVEVGEQFKKGDPLLDFGASPAAVVAYEQAKTALRLAQATRDRAAAKVNAKTASNDALEIAEKAVSDAQLTKDMLEKIGSIKPSEILEAPFDGYVTAILVAKGDRIAAGAPLMTLSETNKPRLAVGVEPSEIEKVKPGQPVNLQSPLSGGKPFQGKVRGVGASIDPITRLTPVTVETAAGSALPGQPVMAQIAVGEFRGWIVPRDAVAFDQNGAYVFQVDESHAKRVDVNVLGTAEDTSVIDGDIKPDLKIVVWGTYQLHDGDEVRTQPAAGGEVANLR